MNMQLLRDYGRLLNDARIGSCDVRSDKGIDGCDGTGLIIGRVSFAFGDGQYRTLISYMHLTYDNLLDAVRAVYAAHPTRVIGDVMHSVKYDTERDTFTMGTTNSSNLELFDVRHTRISSALRDELEYYFHSGDVTYTQEYCTAYVSYSKRSGGYCFTL